MLGKIVLFSFILLPQAFGTSCDFFAEAMKNPDLAKNNAFWVEFSRKDHWTEGELKALKEKYTGVSKSDSDRSSTSQASNSVSATRTLKFDLRAEKEIKALPRELHGKLDEFLKLVGTKEGSLELYKNAGSWAPEKMPGFGKNAHSIRLNSGYRVLYELTPEGEVIIKRVNKGQIHKN